MYSQIFGIIAPVFFVALLGYIWALAKFEYHEKFLSHFVMHVGTPCLILSAIIKAEMPSADLLHLTWITLAGLGLFFMVNSLFLKLYNKPFRTFIGPLSFTNTANMGIPICMLALGEQAVVVAVVIFMISTIVQFSVGVAIVDGRNVFKSMATTPVFYATILAFTISLLDFTVPKPVVDTLDMLGATAIPLMLISLGVSLQSLHIRDFYTSLVMSVVRLLGGFLLGLLICEMFDLQGIVRGVVIIQASMPSGVACYMLARMYDREPKEVAGVVVVSTVLSFLTLPLLLWYIL